MATTVEQRKIEIIANGQKANASFKEMAASASLMNNQLKKMTPGTKEFVDKSKELQKVKSRMVEVREQMYGTQTALNKMKASLQPIGAAFLAAFSIGALQQGFRQIIKVNKEFEKSLSTLSSITGATGKDLQFYAQQAKEIGKTTTLSASDAVEAFKLMGSAKPELLKNKEALASVAREAVVLAEAAGIELPQATQALAGALNQFNLPASEAGRLINALAAGSVAGAAEIPELAQSIDKAGLAARNYNVSVEESVALVEVLSTANIKGAEAGTQLRNILLKMQTVKALPEEAQRQMAKFGVNIAKVSDSTVPFNERLAEMSKIGGDATAMVKVFGIENVNAATQILTNTDLFKEYTAAVTGTSTAYDQQKVNTDNLQGSMDSMNSAIEGLILSFNGEGGLTKAVRAVIDSVTWLVSGLSDANRTIDEIKSKARTDSLSAAIAADKEELEFLTKRFQEVGVAADEYSARQKAINSMVESYLALLKDESDKERIEAIQGQVAALEQYAVSLENQQKAEDAKNTVVTSGTQSIEERTEKVKKLQKAEEEYSRRSLEYARAVEDLKISLMEEGVDKALALLDQKHQKELDKINLQKQEILNNEVLTEQQRQDLLLQLDNEAELRKQEHNKAKREARIEAESEQFDEDLERELLMEENRQLAFQEQASNNTILALEAELEKENAILDIRRQYAQQKLDLLIASGAAESAEALKLKKEILQIEKDKADNQVEYHDAMATAKKRINDAMLADAGSFLETMLAFIKKETVGRQDAVSVLKGIKIAEVIISTRKQIMDAWDSVSHLPFPANIIAAAPQAVAAGVRGAQAIRDITAAKFAKGGFTFEGQRLEAVGSYASGGPVNRGSIGIIGEAGPEWVAPNWMLRSPKHANLLRYLESERQLKAYAAGGLTHGAPEQPVEIPQNSELAESMQLLIEKQEQIIAVLQQWPTTFKVWVDSEEVNKAITDRAEVDQAGTIRR